MSRTRLDHDPIRTEIIRAALNSAADEMNTTLIQSAYTPVIYEMKDCSVALLDASHRVLGQSSGLPIFLGNLEVVTKYTEEMYGPAVWRPGDVWALNDSYIAGTHLHDMTVYGPVFTSDELVGFATCRAHWLDVGGKDVGSTMDSTSIFQEGLRIGATKVIDGGVVREDVVDLLSRASRFHYPARGDLFAQIACVRTGQNRLASIVGKYGARAIADARDDIFAQTERLERSIIGTIPDGSYEAEGCIDSDGLSSTPKWVRVKVQIHGDDMAVDLSETEDQARGPVNCGAAQAVAAVRVAYKVLVNPDTPLDGGSFRPLTVTVRKGSLLDAVEPAPYEWYFTPLGLLIDLVIKALAPVVPERVAAASYGDSMLIGIWGIDPRAGQGFLLHMPTVGGWGAWDGCDGQDALINNVNGSLKDVPIEVAETKYGVYVRKLGFWADSGGAGRWRGGNGVEHEYVIEADEALLYLWFDRSRTPAWGLNGGGDATPPQVVINEGAANERRLLKANGIPLSRGDVVITRTGGGGGYGDPRERDRAAVVRDIREGMISRGRAREVYGYPD